MLLVYIKNLDKMGVKDKKCLYMAKINIWRGLWLMALTVALKLRGVRKADRENQEDIAHILDISPSGVSRIEKGEFEYTEEQENILRKHYHLVGIPLREREYPGFRNNITLMRDYTRDGKIDEAKKVQEKVKGILKLEFCEPDFCTLYRLTEVLLFQEEKKLDDAEKLLSSLQKDVDSFSSENIFHYNSCMGSLYSLQDDEENALPYYKKAYNLRDSSAFISLEDKNRLCFNFANCYSGLERYQRSIMVVNKLDRGNTLRQISVSNLSIDILQANNHTMVFIFDEAEEILQKCLLDATSLDNTFYIGLTNLNLGILYSYSEKWGESVEYTKKSIPLFEKNSRVHLDALYFCAIGSIELKDTEEVYKILKVFESLENKTNANEVLHKTIEHIMAIKSYKSQFFEESVNYIEDVSIPFFIKSRYSVEAARCCELLEKTYGKRKKLESYRMGKEAKELYKRILFDHEGGDNK